MLTATVMAVPPASAGEGGDRAPPPGPGLGQLIDGYRRLSPADQQVFCMANGLAVATFVAPVGLGNQPQHSGPAGPSPVVLGPGHTRDPKTGKVYKVTPKKVHSGERQGLEQSLKDAKSAFSAVLKQHRITIGNDGSPSIDGDLTDPIRQEYTQALSRVNAAKAAYAAYKAAHNEEFRPPVVKKAGGPSAPPQAAKNIRPFPPKGETPVPTGTAPPPPEGGEGTNVAPATSGAAAPVPGAWASQAPTGASQW
jgi:hypothetical protein